MKTKLLSIFVLCFAMSLCVTNVSAISRFVKTTAAGTADGSTWENASANIQAMITASASGDSVQIAAGTYLIGTTLAGKDGVSLIGAYPANAATGNAIRNLSTNQTILDGQKARRIYTSPTDIVLTTITPQRLDGLTFQRGYSASGSAISLYNGVIVQNCKVWNNISDGTNGAAICISGSLITGSTNYGSGAVINSLIINNSSTAVDGGSGGIYAFPATYFAVANCIIANNDCNDPAGSGGLKHSAASSAIFNNVFFGNLNLGLVGANTGLNNYRGYRDATGLNASTNNWFDNDVIPLAPKYTSTINKCRTDFASPNFVLPTTFVGFDDTKMAEIAASDWRVPSTSGCIGYGTKGGISNPIVIAYASIITDLVGNPRISGTLPDLGCYEYQVPAGISNVVESGLVAVKGRTIEMLQSASSITVYNAMGATIHTQNNVTTGAIISVSHSGIYIVKVKSELGLKIQKLIIQ